MVVHEGVDNLLTSYINGNLNLLMIEQTAKKRGFFSWLKIWFYGLCAGIAAFFATKIPWKKIFTKRNFVILLVLVLLFLFARYLLPYFVDVPWGPDPITGTNN